MSGWTRSPNETKIQNYMRLIIQKKDETTFVSEFESVTVIWDVDVPGEEEKPAQLQLKATPEGVVLDVWMTERSDFDTNVGTSSETAQEITERLCK